MRFVALESEQNVASFVADRVAEVVELGETVLGVATGSSPVPAYREIVRRQRSGEIDLRNCHLVLLDDYLGVPPDHPASYHRTIVETLAEPLGIPPTHILGPDTMAPDTSLSCQSFESAIDRLGGVGLQIVGIGRNGHIGFNEPGTAWSSRTHVVELTRSTRNDNARFFHDLDHVPTRAITQGIATILDARRVLLVATGEAKRPVLEQLSIGLLSIDVPASALHCHPRATVVFDQAAQPR